MTTTNENDWIERGEREPREDEYPVYKHDTNLPHRTWRETDPSSQYYTYTHWMPAPKLPPPPKPKEKTQYDLDKEALEELAINAKCWGREQTWFAALAYRDKQNAEDFVTYGFGTATEASRAILRLRKRCGLDK